MSKTIDMTGWVMNEHGIKESKLTVIKRGENSKDGKARWWCKCNCGNPELKLIRGDHIRNGKILSCGCYVKEALSKAHEKHNIYNLDGDFAIGFTEDNEGFLVDKEFVPMLNNFYFWYDEHGYLKAKNKYNDPLNLKVKNIYLHMLVMNAYSENINPSHLLVDHKQHNSRNEKKFDNRLSNLRFVSGGQNNQNRCLSIRNTSGTVGVTFHKETKKWLTQIVVNKEHIYLGLYDDINDAIKARKDAEIKYFKEYRYDANN